MRGTLVAEGVDLREDVEIARVERRGNGIGVVVDGPAAETGSKAAHLLRRGRPAGQCRRAGPRGCRHRVRPKGVVDDARLRTTNRQGLRGRRRGRRRQFTHIAGYHAGIVIRNALFRLPAKVDYRAVPWVTYTDPELAHVGLTEARRRERGLALKALSWPFARTTAPSTEGARPAS